MNTCGSHLKAVDHANSRYSDGYCATGVGAVICARHGLLRKNGVCDLQRGERFVNMEKLSTAISAASFNHQATSHNFTTTLQLKYSFTYSFTSQSPQNVRLQSRYWNCSFSRSCKSKGKLVIPPVQLPYAQYSTLWRTITIHLPNPPLTKTKLTRSLRMA